MCRKKAVPLIPFLPASCLCVCVCGGGGVTNLAAAHPAAGVSSLAFIPVHTVSSLPKALQMALISNPINDSGRKHSSLVLCYGQESKA